MSCSWPIKNGACVLGSACALNSEPEFVNVQGAQESIPGLPKRLQFWALPSWPVRKYACALVSVYGRSVHVHARNVLLMANQKRRMRNRFCSITTQKKRTHIRFCLWAIKNDASVSGFPMAQQAHAHEVLVPLWPIKQLSSQDYLPLSTEDMSRHNRFCTRHIPRLHSAYVHCASD